MSKPPFYTAPMLTKLLAQQSEKRSPGLFKQGVFTLQWRGKVGSFPYPDLETIVSAGEPCGSWKWKPDEDFGLINQRKSILPLNGYIPASAIRGIVRAWANKRPEIKSRMLELLGNQEDDDHVLAGKIQFLDAWTEKATELTLDIVNPQQEFQVFHDSEKQGTPLPLYTLGDGNQILQITVAIRGIPNRSQPDDVHEVWNWVQQALSLYGVGSRTASGYGVVKAPRSFRPTPDLRRLDPGYSIQQFEFILYSQGCYGVDGQRDPELRPSHWRGWLRSWMLRFFLGVMSPHDAEITVGELLGTLESSNDRKSRKGCVRLQLIKGEPWGVPSTNQPTFYTWQGTLKITAPTEILNRIILPVIKFAAMTGGVGRGWRRPLHIFMMQLRDGKQRPAQRGTHLILKQKVRKPNSTETELKLCNISLRSETWLQVYDKWKESVQSQWGNRTADINPHFKAEVFSPITCSVYAVPAPVSEPLNLDDYSWNESDALPTRGEGMELIYQEKYKRKADVGGDAARGGNSRSYCSWVSIKRVNIPNPEEETDCQEVVCLFMGDQNTRRSEFLRDLAHIPGAVHLFGVQP